MKNFRLTVSSLLLTLLCTVAVQAQEKSASTVQKSDAQVNQTQTKRRLELTKEQEFPHREIIKRYAEMAREVRKSSLKMEEKKEKLNVLSLQREAEIKVLLTPEQYKIHLENVELQKARVEEQKSKMVDMKKKAAPGSVQAK